VRKLAEAGSWAQAKKTMDLLERCQHLKPEMIEVIEKAIDSLRAKWSRFRNHPTKSLQAKKIFGMIPEMRGVMLDPELRKKEARRAREKLKQQLESFGFSQIRATAYPNLGVVRVYSVNKDK